MQSGNGQGYKEPGFVLKNRKPSRNQERKKKYWLALRTIDKFFQPSRRDKQRKKLRQKRAEEAGEVLKEDSGKRQTKILDDPIENKENQLVELLTYAYCRSISICHMEKINGGAEIIFRIGQNQLKKTLFINLQTSHTYALQGRIQEKLSIKFENCKSLVLTARVLKDLNRGDEKAVFDRLSKKVK